MRTYYNLNSLVIFSKMCKSSTDSWLDSTGLRTKRTTAFPCSMYLSLFMYGFCWSSDLWDIKYTTILLFLISNAVDIKCFKLLIISFESFLEWLNTFLSLKYVVRWIWHAWKTSKKLMKWMQGLVHSISIMVFIDRLCLVLQMVLL